MWSIEVAAAAPTGNTAGCKSSEQTFASMSRARAPGYADQRTPIRLFRQRGRAGECRPCRLHRRATRRQHEELVRPRPDQQRAIGLDSLRRAGSCLAVAFRAGLREPRSTWPRRAITCTSSKSREFGHRHAGGAFLHAVPARRIDARQRRGCRPAEFNHAGALLPDRRRRGCKARPRSPRRAADRARAAISPIRSRPFCTRPSPIHWSKYRREADRGDIAAIGLWS